jgi:hypothetical protein
MKKTESKEVHSSPEGGPKGVDSGTPESRPGGSPSLTRTMQQIAAGLKRRFPSLIAQDPKKFKKQAVYLLKRHLPPGPGRPAEDAITRAIELRKQGLGWKEIYQQCIPDQSQLPPASRRMARDNLRAACRSRRNAAKRRKRQRTFTSEATTGPNVPSSRPPNSALEMTE